MGKKEEYVVKGAMASCNGSTAPLVAQLSIIIDNIFNEINGNVFATTGTIGPCFGPVPFGTCKLIPPTPAGPVPCACVIVSWSGAYTGIKNNQLFNPLVKSSKGTCVLGGTITFKTSGQMPKPSMPPISTPTMLDMNPAAGKELPKEEKVSLSEDVMNIIKKKAIKSADSGEVIFGKMFSTEPQNLMDVCKLFNDYKILYTIAINPDGTTNVEIIGALDDVGACHMGSASNMSASKSERKPTTGKFETDEKGQTSWHPDAKQPATSYKPKSDTKKKGENTQGPQEEQSNEDALVLEWGESGGNGIINAVENLMNDHRERHDLPRDYTFNGIPYKDKNPDLSQFSFGTIKTKFYTNDRDVNFKIADELMAEKLNNDFRDAHNGADPDPLYTAKAVEDWRKDPEHKMTWHEDPDCQSIMKVPTILHANLPHNGGVHSMKTDGLESHQIQNSIHSTTQHNGGIHDIKPNNI